MRWSFFIVRRFLFTKIDGLNIMMDSFILNYSQNL